MRFMSAWIMLGYLLAGLAPSGAIAAEEDLPLLNDPQRLSSMGKTDLDIDDDAELRALYDAFNPAVANNSHRDILMMVWSGDNDAANSSTNEDISLANDEFEIWGVQVDARNATGTANVSILDSVFRISFMGDEDETDPAERRRYQAFDPDIAFDADEHRFLVVWRADADTDPLVDDEYEIWGRLYQESTDLFGTAEPVDDAFRITTIGNDGETDPAVRKLYGAYEPRVAWDPTTGNYLLVYRSNDPDFLSADNEYEIFGQRLNGDGETVGVPFRVSHMGPDGDPVHGAEKPAVAWNDVAEQFLVAWQGDDTTDGEFEIHASTVSPDGTVSAQQRVSNPDAFDPDVAVNSSTGEYMVAWSGDESINDEFEIYARALDISGSPVGSTFRVSHMGPDSDTNFAAEDPTIAWHKGEQRYLVSWRGDDDTAPLVEGEYQLFAQSLNQDGTLFEARFQISDINPDEPDADLRRSRQAMSPESIYAGGSVYHLWAADGPMLSVDEFEIFIRRTSWSATSVLTSMDWERPEVPDPIVIEFTIDNVGSQTMVDTFVRYSIQRDFPVSWSGCTPRATENACDIGDIAAGEIVSITATLDTSDRAPGDHLGTNFSLWPFSDTALLKAVIDPNDTPDDSSDDVAIPLNRTAFVTVLLRLEGGSGALLPLVPLLLLLWGVVARRRRS